MYFKIILLVLFNTFLLYSETDSLKKFITDEVVISANKFQNRLIEVGSSIEIIDSARIANSKALTIFDILKSEAGVQFTQQGGAGRIANILIRGGNASHTLVLLDGIELNMPTDPNNTYDFGNLPIDNIERIEILKGSQSTLYGSEAMAGVINIITKTGNYTPRFFIAAEGGSYHSYKGTAGSYGKLSDLDYSLTLSRSKTDGYSSASEKYGNFEKDGSDNYNISGKLGYQFLPELKLNLFYNFLRSNIDLDYSGGPFGDHPDYNAKSEENFARAEVTTNFLDNLYSNLSINYTRNFRKYFNSSFGYYDSSDSRYDGNKLKIDFQNTLSLKDNIKLIFGLEHEKETYQSEYFSYGILYPYQSVIPKNSNSITGLYLQNNLDIDNSFFSSIGIRYDYNEIFNSIIITNRFAPAYVFNDLGIKIKGSVGSGYKAPSLYNLFDEMYGNKELKPEESITYDAGIEYFNDYLLAGITFFYNDFTNLIGSDPQTFKSLNIGKAETKGIEFTFQANILEHLKVKANYTYLHSEDKTDYPSNDSYQKEGNRLFRRPLHKAGIVVNYSPVEYINSDFEIVYGGKRDDADFGIGSRIVLNDFTLVNLTLSSNVTNYLEVYIKGINLLDKRYEEVFGYATARRSIFSGIKLNL